MMKHLICILFVSFLVSCTQGPEQLPKGTLSEAQMIDALVDVHLLEAAAQLNMLEGIKLDSLTLQDYYRALFETKSYSLAAFDSSFAHYAKDPEMMERLMDSVLTNIQMME
ncbi:MAG: DUF4296 domain-containing protein [Flavobacteriales bacterium]|nr:DUF4296 domain-containing protein [Flavobacteriales bacterium]